MGSHGDNQDTSKIGLVVDFSVTTDTLALAQSIFQQLMKKIQFLT
jgi:hypothetical protein